MTLFLLLLSHLSSVDQPLLQLYDLLQAFLLQQVPH
jgi:hypothetical protein